MLTVRNEHARPKRRIFRAEYLGVIECHTGFLATQSRQTCPSLWLRRFEAERVCL